jgi:hypothetical protein
MVVVVMVNTKKVCLNLIEQRWCKNEDDGGGNLACEWNGTVHPILYW